MNYEKIYSSLILSRRIKPTKSEYHEKHHIIPRALGGDDSKSNLIKLTAREHFFAHRLLAKIHGGSMWYALSIMQSRVGKVSSRTFETMRINISKVHSEFMKGSVPHNKGTKASIELREKLSKAHKGKVFAPEHREKVIKALRSRERDSEWSENISKSLLGHTVSDATKKKISKSLLGNIPANKGIAQTKVECPSCGKIGGKNVMKRWHFDNCKLLVK